MKQNTLAVARRSERIALEPRLEKIMNPNKALWEKGGFAEIAALMRQSGEALVKSLGISGIL